MKKYFYRIRRYIIFIFQVLFIEKPRGLDFTMFDTSALQKTGGKFHGYSKTGEKHLREIFNLITKERDSKSLSIIDVGCGKGVVLKEAAAYDFARIGGVELMPEIAEIAYKNMRILNLENRVELRCADATIFDGYEAYNVFFFFNPFSREIFEKVIDKISEAVADKEILIIYHHPLFADIIEKFEMQRTDVLFDELKRYETYIYRGRLVR